MLNLRVKKQINIVTCYYRYGGKGATVSKVLGNSKIDWGKIEPFSKKWGFLIHPGMFPDLERRKLQKRWGKYLNKKDLI